MPEVSVIIPAYNAADTLGATLSSVLEQTYSDCEIIVIDDGSTDQTASVAARFGSPVVCIRQANAGVSEARNRGLARARGRYVAFLDADDLWKPTKLQEQLQLLDLRPDAGACFTSYFRVDSSLNVTGYQGANHCDDFCEALLLRSMVVQLTSTGMVRKAVADGLGGFDPALSQCADWDYTLRLSTITEFAQVDRPLVCYRQSHGSMSGDIGLLESDTVAVLDKFFASPIGDSYRALRRQCYSNHWLIIAGSYLHDGQYAAATRCVFNAIQLYPRNVTRVLGLPLRWSRRIVSQPADYDRLA